MPGPAPAPAASPTPPGPRHRRFVGVSRTRPGRPVTLLLAAVVALLSVAAAPSTPASAVTAPAPRVLVVAVPDLLWSDVTRTGTPTLWRLLGTGSAGALTVKSAWQLAGCADGLLTLGAGDRAAAEGSAATPLGCVDEPPARFRALDRRVHSTASLGALAAALGAAGVPFSTSGDGATLALPPPSAAGPAQVELVVDDALYAALPAGRATAATQVDHRLAQLIDPLPSTSTVLVVGSSDAGPRPPGSGGRGDARLHVALAHGPGFPAGYLSSPSTRRTPYAELIDVAPTVLGLVSAPVPPGMVGRPWHPATGPAGAGERLAHLQDLDVKAVQGARWRPWFMWALSLAGLAVAAGALVGLSRRPRSGRPGAPAGATAVRLLVAACFVVASLPVASWLVQLVPWWRWNVLLLPVLLLLVSGVVGAGAAVAGRRVPRRGLYVVTGVSGGVLAADLLTGSRLQTAALLGDSPITAGRFFGAGNTAFGVLAASALLGAAVLCGVAASAPVRTARRRAVLAGLLMAAAAFVDASPTVGADLGGALALVPSAVLVVVLLARLRVSARRLPVVVAVAAAPVVALALWDYHRPPSRRTHIGIFVGQVLHGQAGPVLGRKLAANLGQLVGSPFVVLVVAAVVLLVVVLRGHRPRVGRMLDDSPGLAAGLAGWAVCAVLGGLLNDSGVTVTGIMISVALPTVAALALVADPCEGPDGS